MDQPQIIERAKLDIDLADYLPPGGQSKPGAFRVADAEDCKDFITESTVVKDPDEGVVKIVYLKLPPEEDTSEVVRMLRRINYDTDARSNGMLSIHKIFGYMPRITHRHDYCRSAKLAIDDREAHDKVMAYAERVGRYYQQFHPDLYAEHQRLVDQVLPDYKIKNSVFTSGIINKNNQLPYHKDQGNFKNVWSNMLVFKRNCDGGHLAVPEYDMTFEVADNSLLMFDGQNLLHGVTPFKRHSYRDRTYYRFSVVFYSLQNMWKCLPPDEELRRIQQKRTEREQNRAAPIPLTPEMEKALEGRRK